MTLEQTSLADLQPVRVRTGPASPSLGELTQDLFESLKRRDAWLYSAWIDVLLSYRSTALGPLWILVGTTVFVLSVGLLYGHVVQPGSSDFYLAHLTVGITFWYFMTQVIVKSCNLFFSDRAALLDADNTYTDVILKNLTREVILYLHNFVVVVVVLVVSKVHFGLSSLLLVYAVPLVLLNLLWMSVILAILGARYGDLQELIHSLLRLAFFLTPIIWSVDAGNRSHLIMLMLYVNPFFYLLEVIREPMVYDRAPWLELGVLTLAFPLGWLLASYLYARTKSSVALWL